MFQHLTSVSDTWCTLGIFLNINQHTLRKIDMDYRIQGVDRCLVELIHLWEQQSSDPKLSELLRALISSGMIYTAVNIARDYGKYLILVTYHDCFCLSGYSSEHVHNLMLSN